MISNRVSPHSSAIQNITRGVFKHASTSSLNSSSSYVEWITPISRCSNKVSTYKFTTLGLWGERNTKTGSWCPADPNKKHYFICEKPSGTTLDVSDGHGTTAAAMQPSEPDQLES